MNERGLTVRLRLQDLIVRYSTVYPAEMNSEIRPDRNDTLFSMQPSERLFNIVMNNEYAVATYRTVILDLGQL